jgi:hypothetical protein
VRGFRAGEKPMAMAVIFTTAEGWNNPRIHGWMGRKAKLTYKYAHVSQVPVILVTWEAEIGRTEVQGQVGK